jgi:hypothetical protein
MLDDIPYLTPERETILALLRKADIPVYQDVGFCDEGHYSGFATSDAENKSIMIVVCTESIKEVFPNKPRQILEFNRTVDHEALHAAQFCKNNYYPGTIANDAWDNEAEALYYEDKPQAVGQKLIEFCF